MVACPASLGCDRRRRRRRRVAGPVGLRRLPHNAGVTLADATNAPDSAATHSRQCAGGVCMLRPATFGFNAETAATNHLQHAGAHADRAGDARRARDEFDVFVAQLRAAGVRVAVLEDEPVPPRPDAVFPNNWISFHGNGTVVLYPMQSPSRRRERRPEAMIECARSPRIRAPSRARSDPRRRSWPSSGRHGKPGPRSRRESGLLRAVAAQRCRARARVGDGDALRTGNVRRRHWRRRVDLPHQRAAVDRRTHCRRGPGLDRRVRSRAHPRAAGRHRPHADGAGRAASRCVRRQHARAARDRRTSRARAVGQRGRLVRRPATRDARGRCGYARLAAVPTIELRGGGSVRCMLAEVP